MRFPATGIPVGMFCTAEFGVESIKLEKGDTLLLYTDGLSEAAVNGIEYGEERMINQVRLLDNLNAGEMIKKLPLSHKDFVGDALPADDITIAY